jgi:hypothetical protein
VRDGFYDTASPYELTIVVLDATADIPLVDDYPPEPKVRIRLLLVPAQPENRLVRARFSSAGPRLHLFTGWFVPR